MMSMCVSCHVHSDQTQIDDPLQGAELGPGGLQLRAASAGPELAEPHLGRPGTEEPVVAGGDPPQAAPRGAKDRPGIEQRGGGKGVSCLRVSQVSSPFSKLVLGMFFFLWGEY